MDAKKILPTFNQEDVSEGAFKQLMLDHEGFDLLSEYLKVNIGISMPRSAKNLSLMAGRLTSIMKKNGLTDYKQLYARLKAGDGTVTNQFVCALTTNTTHWFRESQHFDHLSQYVQKKIANSNEPFTVWCAASSIGHEPYTISIVLHEAYQKLNKTKNCKILASDIDDKVLQKAASSCYTEAELNGLSESQIKLYLEQKKGDISIYYRVKEEIASPVQFTKLNLLDQSYPFKKQFDVIFCRNVFIYFEKDVIAQIIERMSPFIKKGGLLFIGHAEAGVMKSSKFKQVAHAVYERL